MVGGGGGGGGGKSEVDSVIWITEDTGDVDSVVRDLKLMGFSRPYGAVRNKGPVNNTAATSYENSGNKTCPREPELAL